MKSYHPLINPVTPSAQVVINGKRLSPKRGQSVPYVERRYRLISNTEKVSFMNPDQGKLFKNNLL